MCVGDGLCFNVGAKAITALQLVYHMLPDTRVKSDSSKVIVCIEVSKMSL